MDRFYGTVQGGRGEATRLGHATSGLDVSAQSYSGDIVARLFDQDGEDWCWIRIQKHGGADYQILYRGPIKDLLDQSARATMMKAFVSDMLTDGADYGVLEQSDDVSQPSAEHAEV